MPRTDGDVFLRRLVAVRAPPQGHVVERRVPRAHVGDAGELVQPEPVARLVAVGASVLPIAVTGTERVAGDGDVALAHDLHDRYVHVVERVVREPRREVAVIDRRAIVPSLRVVRLLDVVAGHASGLRVPARMT